MMRILFLGMVSWFILLAVGVTGVHAKWYVGDDLGYLDYVTVNGNQFDNLHDSEVVFYREDLIDGKVEIRGILESTQRGVVVADLKVQVSLDGGQSWADAEGDARWSYAFKPRVEQAYRLSVRVVRRSAEGGVVGGQFVLLSGTTGDSEGGEDVDLTHRGDGVSPEGGDPLVVRQVGAAPKPAFISELEKKILVPLVAHLEVTLNNYNVDGNLHWSVSLRNIDAHETLEADRYELRVVQVLDLPGQTVPAGLAPVFEIPYIVAGGAHGFGSGYEKNLHAQKLRAQVWDRLAKAVVAQQSLVLPQIGENGSVHANSDTDRALFEGPQLFIETGSYLGRGVWQLQLRTNNMMFPAGRFSYTYTYRFADESNSWQFDTPKDIIFPIGPTPKILLETTSFYGPQATDCSQLRGVDVEIFDKDTEEVHTFTIPVRIPLITMFPDVPSNSISKYLEVYNPTSGKKPLFLRMITNTSEYNLLLGYTVDLMLEREISTNPGGPVLSTDIEEFQETGVIMLSAGTRRDATLLIDDIHTVLPHFQEWRDLMCYPNCTSSYEDRDYMILKVMGRITISMPGDAPCSHSRRLIRRQYIQMWTDGGSIDPLN